MINRARIIRRTGQPKTDHLANLLGSAATSTLDQNQKRELDRIRKRKLAARSRDIRGSNEEENGAGDGDGDSSPDAAISPLDLIRKRPLAKRLGVSPWTVDRWRTHEPDFPKPIWISSTMPAWRVADIERWLASRQRGGLAPAWEEHR